ncbi:MAG: hypothetical protein AAGD01_01965 [Acidobacteriota bacterium]
MKRLLSATVLSMGIVLAPFALAQDNSSNAPVAPSTATSAAIDFAAIPAGDVERGRYIVEHVSLCVQCHTPRDQNGELDRSRWLQGAPVPMDAPYWTDDWAFRAPAIYSFVGYDRAQALELLITGIARDGEEARLPMPPFRMNEEDAAAVVDFLLSSRK